MGVSGASLLTESTDSMILVLIHAKAMIRLAFPVYVISLVIIIIVIGQYSSKFAKIVGKGNPVAVLAMMILISYSRPLLDQYHCCTYNLLMEQ